MLRLNRGYGATKPYIAVKVKDFFYKLEGRSLDKVQRTLSQNKKAHIEFEFENQAGEQDRLKALLPDFDVLQSLEFEEGINLRDGLPPQFNRTLQEEGARVARATRELLDFCADKAADLQQNGIHYSLKNVSMPELANDFDIDFELDSKHRPYKMQLSPSDFRDDAWNESNIVVQYTKSDKGYPSGLN